MADVNPGLTRRNLPLLLLLAREAVIARFRPLLNEHGLTEQQWRILRVLVEVPALEPRQIVRLCGISSPSLAGILARMEEQGLVAREGLAHDRRRQAVSATAKSRHLAARMAPRIEAVYAALETQVGPEVLARLQATLDAVTGALEATAEGGRKSRPPRSTARPRLKSTGSGPMA